MKCPECKSSWLTVVETRQTTPEAISRKRKCNVCDHHFATAEVIVPKSSIAWIKSDRKNRSTFAIDPSLLAHLVSESHFLDSERSKKPAV